MRRITRCIGVLAVLAFAVLGSASFGATAAQAHEERQTTQPLRNGSVPAYRSNGPMILVCKSDRADFERRVAGFPTALKEENLRLWDQCQADGFRHVQAAVDAARLPGTNIKILPGVYKEEPSLAPPSAACQNTWDTAPKGKVYAEFPILNWDQQLACPNLTNLVAVLGKRNLQIEGTGASREDVIIDAEYNKLNTVRADNADGVYFKNFTAQRSEFNAFYIIETDGFVVDNTLGRWNDEYGFLTFAVDHGLYTDCEGYGNGDSAFYPGAAANINKDKGHDVPRYAVEIRRCKGHHNTLGYSGTAGDSVWVHDSEFTDNTTGIATDSAFPNHPGMPQNHSKFERNIIANNNTDYYRHIVDGTCKKPFKDRGYEDGVVCPAVGLPVGGGVVNPGGNYNIWRDNWIYGNNYSGFITSYVPAFVREEWELNKQFDTSHHNRYLGNHMGIDKQGKEVPNALNFWWDGQGTGNCWTSMANTNIRTVPGCGADDLPAIGSHRYFGEPAATLKMLECAAYSRGEQFIPGGCDWYGQYAATGFKRVEVRHATAGAAILLIAALLLFFRRLRGSRTALTGLLLSAAGLAIGVLGTIQMGSIWHPIGLLLYGIGFVAIGHELRMTRTSDHRRPDLARPSATRHAGGRSGTRKLGMATYVVALFALLGAIDHGLIMLPYLPVSPALLRLLAEIVWVPWAVGAAILVRRPAKTAVDTAPEVATATP